MAKEVKLSFSHEHKGSNGKQEWDTHRSTSDRPGVEKVGHNDVTPGYGQQPVSIPVQKK